MFNLNMDIKENFAAFQYNNKVVYIDSFDNENFELRYGTIEKTKKIAKIHAKTTEQLNEQLQVIEKQLLSINENNDNNEILHLSYKRESRKYIVEELKISDQDAIKITELFVNTKLQDCAQEVFYAELENKEINKENVKNALYQAVLSQTSVAILSKVIDEYKEDPEKMNAEISQHVENQK